jgi:DNA recombination protein RmuC
MVILVTILIVLTVVAVVLVGLSLASNAGTNKDIAKQSTSIDLLQRQLEAIRTSQDKQAENFTKNLQTSSQSIDKHLLSTKETLEKLNQQLGHLKGDSERMLQLGTDIRSLQDILKSPKLRGQLGEQSLEKILKEILPAESFTAQHTFANGKIVDCLVKMPDYSVPIDAKFPLPSFEAIIQAKDESDQANHRRQFQKDVVKHIDKIAANYINPSEGTLDFALMYIPAENVYYETIIKYKTDAQDILSYALDKKVIPVSPNLLYAYLMTIVMGLRGLQIEKQAARIRQDIGTLTGSINSFTNCFDVLGRHLRNAAAQYDQGQSQLVKFSSQLNQIQTDPEQQQLDTPLNADDQ